MINTITILILCMIIVIYMIIIGYKYKEKVRVLKLKSTPNKLGSPKAPKTSKSLGLAKIPKILGYSIAAAFILFLAYGAISWAIAGIKAARRTPAPAVYTKYETQAIDSMLVIYHTDRYTGWYDIARHVEQIKYKYGNSIMRNTISWSYNGATQPFKIKNLNGTMGYGGKGRSENILGYTNSNAGLKFYSIGNNQGKLYIVFSAKKKTGTTYIKN